MVPEATLNLYKSTLRRQSEPHLVRRTGLLPPEFYNCCILVPAVDFTYVEKTIPCNTLEQI
eukprot:scaffold79926_cov30-Attheya_sp.AAC.1